MTREEIITRLDTVVEKLNNPNAIGFMRGVSGSKFYRAPPKGTISNELTDGALEQILQGAEADLRWKEMTGG